MSRAYLGPALGPGGKGPGGGPSWPLVATPKSVPQAPEIPRRATRVGPRNFRGPNNFPISPNLSRPQPWADVAKSPEFPRRRALRPETGRQYAGVGRRGGRIWGVAIGSAPGPISGANALHIRVFWGRGPVPQAPNTSSRLRGDISNARGFQNSPNLKNSRDVGPCAPKRIVSMGAPGAAGVGSGKLRLAASRARFRALTACEARFSGVGARPPGAEYPLATSRGFLECPQLPESAKSQEFPRRQILRPETGR